MQTNHLAHYETMIMAPVEKVWDALTVPALVKQYFFGTDLVTTWEPGSPIYFRGEWEEKKYEDKGVVKEYIPYTSLLYSYISEWSGLPDEEENYLMVKYTLEATVNGTLLKITQSNYDEEKAKHTEENWASLMDGLKKLVE